MSITGKTCDEAVAVPIKAINVSTLECVDTFTDTSIYIVPTEGLCELTLGISDVTGTATIVVKGQY